MCDIGCGIGFNSRCYTAVERRRQETNNIYIYVYICYVRNETRGVTAVLTRQKKTKPENGNLSTTDERQHKSIKILYDNFQMAIFPTLRNASLMKIFSSAYLRTHVYNTSVCMCFQNYIGVIGRPFQKACGAVLRRPRI